MMRTDNLKWNQQRVFSFALMIFGFAIMGVSAPGVWRWFSDATPAEITAAIHAQKNEYTRQAFASCLEKIVTPNSFGDTGLVTHFDIWACANSANSENKIHDQLLVIQSAQ